VQKIPLDAGLTCPNRDGTKGSNGCLYCNNLGSGTGEHVSIPDVAEQMMKGMAFCAKHYKARKFIAYFQSFTNTYGSIELLKSLYRSALISKDVVGLSVSTRPDCVDEEILFLLEDLARECMVWIEYGLQSAHDETLRRINRGHTFQDFVTAIERTRSRSILTCAHVILGLPGEDPCHMLETAKKISTLGLDGLKLHLLYVLKGTALEKLYLNGGYRCLEMDEYVDLVVDFLELIPDEVVVQRLTGDPNPVSDLVAPQWATGKQKILNLIKQRFDSRDTWQGKYSISIQET
jgi:uncharacterized protein